MKKVFVLLLIAFPFIAQAQQIELYGRYTKGGKVAADINCYATKKISDKLSLTFFGLVEKSWGEGLIGLSYSPTNSFSIGASMGIEHGSDKPRFGASMWTSTEKLSLLLLTEKGAGKDNYWYRSNLWYKASDKFTYGATVWRYHGLGPNIRYTIKKAVTLWVMPAYDFEVNEGKAMAGIAVKL